MPSTLGRLSRKGLFNPVARAAVLTWVWNHRHEVFRWGRSLWDQLVGRGDIRPASALRIARLLVALTADDTLRNAPELRKVTLVDDVVDLDVQPGWRELPRLVDKVRSVKGIAAINVNGSPVTVI